MTNNYLQDLVKKNINIASTLFVEKGDEISLKQLFEKTNWTEAVIKPAISAEARHTYRINASNFSEFETVFQELISEECMLL